MNWANIRVSLIFAETTDFTAAPRRPTVTSTDIKIHTKMEKRDRLDILSLLIQMKAKIETASEMNPTLFKGYIRPMTNKSQNK